MSKKTIAQKLREAKAQATKWRTHCVNSVNIRNEQAAKLGELEQQLAAAKAEAAKVDSHYWRIESILLDWIPVFNKLYVSVDMDRDDPYVNFKKGPFHTAVHKRHLLHYGLRVVIDMFTQVPGEDIVCNHIDGKDNWVHPEAQAGEKERALEQAGEILARSGLIPGTNVTVKVGDPDA